MGTAGPGAGDPLKEKKRAQGEEMGWRLPRVVVFVRGLFAAKGRGIAHRRHKHLCPPAAPRIKCAGQASPTAREREPWPTTSDAEAEEEVAVSGPS